MGKRGGERFMRDRDKERERGREGEREGESGERRKMEEKKRTSDSI